MQRWFMLLHLRRSVYHSALALITNCGAHTCHPTLWGSEVFVAKSVEETLFFGIFPLLRTLWVNLHWGEFLSKKVNRRTDHTSFFTKHEMATKKACTVKTTAGTKTGDEQRQWCSDQNPATFWSSHMACSWQTVISCDPLGVNQF